VVVVVVVMVGLLLLAGNCWCLMYMCCSGVLC